MEMLNGDVGMEGECKKEGGDKVHVLQGAAWEAVIVREHVLCLLCITDCSNNC